VAGLLLLVVASDAAFALTRNVRFGPIVWHRAPTIGCWLEAAALAIGSAIPLASLRVPNQSRAPDAYSTGYRGMFARLER
jgi:hypothetical protein